MHDAPAVTGRHISAKALVALVLSTVFSVVPLIPSAVAVIVGTSARREIARDRNLVGDGAAMAGVVLGVLGVLVWLAVILAAVFFIDVARSVVG